MVSTLVAGVVAIGVALVLWHLLLQQRVKQGEVTAGNARASTRRFALVFVPLAVLVIVLAKVVSN